MLYGSVHPDAFGNATVILHYLKRLRRALFLTPVAFCGDGVNATRGDRLLSLGHNTGYDPSSKKCLKSIFNARKRQLYRRAKGSQVGDVQHGSSERYRVSSSEIICWGSSTTSSQQVSTQNQQYRFSL
jgi:hypothetical protein